MRHRPIIGPRSGAAPTSPAAVGSGAAQGHAGRHRQPDGGGRAETAPSTRRRQWRFLPPTKGSRIAAASAIVGALLWVGGTVGAARAGLFSGDPAHFVNPTPQVLANQAFIRDCSATIESFKAYASHQGIDLGTVIDTVTHDGHPKLADFLANENVPFPRDEALDYARFLLQPSDGAVALPSQRLGYTLQICAAYQDAERAAVQDPAVRLQLANIAPLYKNALAAAATIGRVGEPQAATEQFLQFRGAAVKGLPPSITRSQAEWMISSLNPDTGAVAPILERQIDPAVARVVVLKVARDLVSADLGDVPTVITGYA